MPAGRAASSGGDNHFAGGSMVLLIPDAVRKIKAQGYAEGLAEARAERYEENFAKGRMEARRIISDALPEYRRREGIGMEDPLPVPSSSTSSTTHSTATTTAAAAESILWTSQSLACRSRAKLRCSTR